MGVHSTPGPRQIPARVQAALADYSKGFWQQGHAWSPVGDLRWRGPDAARNDDIKARCRHCEADDRGNPVLADGANGLAACPAVSDIVVDFAT
jgi:hypothetical protein